MNRVEREVQDIERFEEIVAVLFEQGFRSFLDRADLLHRVPLLRRARRPRHKEPGPERLRETFEKLGPTFIKFGQILAQRPDLIPKEYTKELEKLEDSVPSFPADEAREIVDQEVGLENFEEFEEEPVAAASIAQVHRGKLENGDRIAVKVRRPGIKEEMEKDLDILKFLAKEADKHLSIARGMAYDDIKEFADWTMDELDLKKEGRNSETLRDNLKDEERIRIPEIYPDLTTKKVLVMEYVEGTKSNNIEEIKKKNLSAEEIANTGLRAYIKQVIRDGFFHADPHPSNFLIGEDGELILIDFGMVGKFSKEMRRDMGLMILHAYKEDLDALIKTIERIGYPREDADPEQLKKDIEKDILELKYNTIEEKSISKTLVDMSVKSADNGIYMPSSLMMVGKGLVTMEGIGLAIYPDFKVEEEFKTTVEKILVESHGPRETFESLMIDFVENQELLAKLPSKLNELTERKPPEVNIEKDPGIHDEVILASTLIIGSSILLFQSLPAEQAIQLGILELVIAAGVLWHRK